MTNYKVVVLDMDDTLLNSDNVISEETANYLTAIQDEGYYVVLASGRPTEGMIPTARDLKLPEHHSFIISYNGSKTINMTNEEVEVSKSIGKQDFDEIVDYVSNITEARIDLNGVFNDNVDATTSKPFFLEFMAKDVSKGNAIKALCQKLGYSVDQVIAFGDSMNDKSMFEVAGLAIAMGNASDELKQYADEITLDHNENGIPHALKKLL
ncbi:TPA: HAD family phosphatase [Staphylococcus aureus]|nr:HAD family phosphatase [Staphylococcus aureus]HDI7331817.1 HAD family phosphatase [Staphylococcus aureus]